MSKISDEGAAVRVHLTRDDERFSVSDGPSEFGFNERASMSEGFSDCPEEYNIGNALDEVEVLQLVTVTPPSTAGGILLGGDQGVSTEYNESMSVYEEMRLLEEDKSEAQPGKGNESPPVWLGQTFTFESVNGVGCSVKITNALECLQLASDESQDIIFESTLAPQEASQAEAGAAMEDNSNRTDKMVRDEDISSASKNPGFSWCRKRKLEQISGHENVEGKPCSEVSQEDKRDLRRRRFGEIPEAAELQQLKRVIDLASTDAVELPLSEVIKRNKIDLPHRRRSYRKLGCGRGRGNTS